MAREKIITPTSAGAEEEQFNVTLRPRWLDECIGAAELIEKLRIAIAAARQRKEPMEHVLLHGPPGLGKTTMAHVIAAEMHSAIKVTSGPALTRPGDLVGILTNLEACDVLFIDEIHRLDARVEEYLYTAMEEFRIAVVIDSGPHSRSISLPLKHFTLIGATTREGLLTPPLRSRFQIRERLDFYPPADIADIIRASAGKLGLEVEESAVELLASAARGTPRVANRYLRRVRDVAHVLESETITRAVAAECLKRLGVDEHGVCEMDRRILGALAQNPGRPLGLKTIAVMVSEQEDTIEDVYEPFLIQQGMLEKTSRGRMLTPLGMKYLGLDPGAGPPPQKKLF
jgi:Holliday junction DNA helicase RuvB